MKLLRVGPKGEEQPAVIPQGETDAYDLLGLISDFDPEFFASSGLERVSKAIKGGKLSKIDLTNKRIGAPLVNPQKIICIGLNYREHAREGNMEIPKEPIIFMKAPNTIIGPTDEIIIPRLSLKTDWEVELCVVIGKQAKYIKSPQEALNYVAGYAVSNDVSEREFQLERGGQWDKGKSCETFNPLGPWLVTTDEVSDPQKLALWLKVNGNKEQSSNTSDMIFDVAYLIWYTSQFMVLDPGDMINTGTPQGVGNGKKPQQFLQQGDIVELGITGLGEQKLRVVGST
ncbi:MAG: fumarylacetoacetate hydrolase family protein [Acidimicrobiaceae bacterium]|nr:fumarylacetoacetate hydrolase family protein [Acidimicrobiaceae bacterium]